MAVPAGRSIKKAAPAFPGRPGTKALTLELTWASHLSRASEEPDHVDVLATIANLPVQRQLICARHKSHRWRPPWRIAHFSAPVHAGAAGRPVGGPPPSFRATRRPELPA